ncbi:sugar transport stp1 [Fusarium longipes]|uniref:Sugar transport stp1 n=1 Tax=Fusarium longipes TaxID=694270 RepID=A0A395T226_9HYPO|nr:sugar transport stp1 [Fusarium longipes]
MAGKTTFVDGWEWPKTDIHGDDEPALELPAPEEILEEIEPEPLLFLEELQMEAEEKRKKLAEIGREAYYGRYYTHLENTEVNWSLEGRFVCRVPRCPHFGQDFNDDSTLSVHLHSQEHKDLEEWVWSFANDGSVPEHASSRRWDMVRNSSEIISIYKEPEAELSNLNGYIMRKFSPLFTFVGIVEAPIKAATSMCFADCGHEVCTEFGQDRRTCDTCVVSTSGGGETQMRTRSGSPRKLELLHSDRGPHIRQVNDCKTPNWVMLFHNL